MIRWESALSVGDEKLDQQHRRLLGLFNEVHEAVESDRGDAAVDGVLDELIRYAHEHFSEEEAFLEQIGFPDLESHRREHTDFTARVLRMRDETRRDGKMLEVFRMLAEWLRAHIMSSDFAYRDFHQDQLERNG